MLGISGKETDYENACVDGSVAGWVYSDLDVGYLVHRSSLLRSERCRIAGIGCLHPEMVLPFFPVDFTGIEQEGQERV